MKNKCHVHLFIVEWGSVLPNYKVKSSSVTSPVEVKNRLQWVIGNSALEFILRIGSPIACNIHNLYLPAGPLLPSPLSIYPPPPPPPPLFHNQRSNHKVALWLFLLSFYYLSLLSLPPLSICHSLISLSPLSFSFLSLYLSSFSRSLLSGLQQVHGGSNYWNDDSFSKK